MSDILQVLLEYAERTNMRRLLYDAGYWAAARQKTARWEAFQRRLDAAQWDCLNALLEEDPALHATEVEAAFHAGLSLGLELSRL